MATNLTEQAITLINREDFSSEDMKPVLQVLDLKPSQSLQNGATEEYGLVLSDGSYYQQGMLACQKNELINTGRLQKGSIIKLTQFICTLVQNLKVIIIIDLDVILETCDLIGEPLPIPRTAPAPSSAVQLVTTAGNSQYSSSSTPAGPNMAKPSMDRPKMNHPASIASSSSSESARYGLRRIIPIVALNPYLSTWTIKARVTAKRGLRHYGSAVCEGKMFSFDLLDSDFGEIRAICFNSVADQFYHQIEAGKVYLISNGSIRPAQKNFNHLCNDQELTLDMSTIIQPFCDDESIPIQSFNYRTINEVESMDPNSIVDVIGVVFSISPAVPIIRKNGTETQKCCLQLKDMSGRSVKLTLWGNFCDAEGTRLRSICDSEAFPILAVKAAIVYEFNGKALGTTGTSKLFIEPDFPEAYKLKQWFEKEGRNIPAVSISGETSGVSRTYVRKTISQIKDEKLGTSEKPDWITLCAIVRLIKVDNFCYTACPIMIGHRQCNKKVINNGDGTWRCDYCDQLINACEYRYILQFQIQDHTGSTWVTAFQECGEEIIGVTARDLYHMKYEEKDDAKFAEVIHKVLFTRFNFQLKIEEKSDKQRVKMTVVKMEKVNFSSESRYILDLINECKTEKADVVPNFAINNGGLGNVGSE